VEPTENRPRRSWLDGLRTETALALTPSELGRPRRPRRPWLLHPQNKDGRDGPGSYTLRTETAETALALTPSEQRRPRRPLLLHPPNWDGRDGPGSDTLRTETAETALALTPSELRRPRRPWLLHPPNWDGRDGPGSVKAKSLLFQFIVHVQELFEAYTIFDPTWPVIFSKMYRLDIFCESDNKSKYNFSRDGPGFTRRPWLLHPPN
jgi:hypothetical protein